MLPITLEINFRYITSFNAHYLLQKSILAAIPYIRTNGYPLLLKTKYYFSSLRRLANKNKDPNPASSPPNKVVL